MIIFEFTIFAFSVLALLIAMTKNDKQLAWGAIFLITISVVLYITEPVNVEKAAQEMHASKKCIKSHMYHVPASWIVSYGGSTRDCDSGMWSDNGGDSFEVSKKPTIQDGCVSFNDDKLCGTFRIQECSPTQITFCDEYELQP